MAGPPEAGATTFEDDAGVFDARDESQPTAEAGSAVDLRPFCDKQSGLTYCNDFDHGIPSAQGFVVQNATGVIDSVDFVSSPSAFHAVVAPSSLEASAGLSRAFTGSFRYAKLSFDMRFTRFSTLASNVAEVHVGPHTWAFIVDANQFLTHEYFSSSDSGATWANGATVYSLVGPWFHADMVVEIDTQRVTLLINGQVASQSGFHTRWDAGPVTLRVGEVVIRQPKVPIELFVDNVTLETRL